MKTHKELIDLYPNICRLGDDGILELYCDNHILASFRSCEAYFQEHFLNNLSFRSIEGSENLQIGIWFHKVMEPIYKELKNNNHIPMLDVIAIAKKTWLELNIDRFKDTRAYEELGGMENALLFIAEYYKVFDPSKEYFKVIASELTFGYDKEVPILTSEQDFNDDDPFLNLYKDTPFRAYLVGRPDVIVESSLGIGPLDFKTTSRIEGVRDFYKPYDAITGYVYAVDKILGHIGVENKKSRYACLVACSKKQVGKKIEDRFRRIHYSYSDGELNAYLLRTRQSFVNVYRVMRGLSIAQWDTSKCNAWYFRKCPFHKLHCEANENRQAIIDTFYVKNKPWNPQTRGENDDN